MAAEIASSAACLVKLVALLFFKKTKASFLVGKKLFGGY
jgi:hypothetical protein